MQPTAENSILFYVGAYLILHSVIVVLGFIAAASGLFLAFLSQRYWFAHAWKLAGRIHDPVARKRSRGVLVAVVVFAAVLALTAATRSMRGVVPHGSWTTEFFGFWLAGSISAYLCMKTIAGVKWLWKRVRKPSPEKPAPVAMVPSLALAGAQEEHIDHSRRYFFQAAGVMAGVVPFVSAAYGFVADRFQFSVREIEIPIANLPPAMDGMRITQLSDIHIGAYMPAAQVRRAVGMANELNGHLAVVTGDFVSGKSDPLEECIAELSHLRAPLGVWGCNGNHEIYAQAEAKSAQLFQRFGMKLLRLENAELRWQGSAFNLIGVDYQRQHDTEGKHPAMLAGVDPLVRHDVPNILLSHNPNSFRKAAELGIELSLAGHTHGGQVKVEILDHRWSPAQFLTPYVAGLYRRPLLASANIGDAADDSGPSVAVSDLRCSSAIYVNRGLGTIGAPIRLGVPPEITLITLRRAV